MEKQMNQKLQSEMDATFEGSVCRATFNRIMSDHLFLIREYIAGYITLQERPLVSTVQGP